jgi:hypothetical protein
LVLGGGFCFRYRSSFDGQNQRNYSPLRGSLDRLDRNVQISLGIYVLDGRIQRSLAEVAQTASGAKHTFIRSVAM